MIIQIKKTKGELPEVEPRQKVRGRELGCFIPAGYEWKQVNYGQGEGQFLIEENEWGAYYSSFNTLRLVLHLGVVDFEKALQFIKDFADHVKGKGEIEMKIVGNFQDEPAEGLD